MEQGGNNRSAEDGVNRNTERKNQYSCYEQACWAEARAERSLNQALRTLRTAEFKPYVVFVRPHICEGQRKPLGSSSSLGSLVTEDELHEMKQSTEKMDECSSSWVDYVLVEEDPVGALAELQAVLARVQTECQWVPASWARSST